MVSCEHLAALVVRKYKNTKKYINTKNTKNYKKYENKRNMKKIPKYNNTQNEKILNSKNTLIRVMSDPKTKTSWAN